MFNNRTKNQHYIAQVEQKLNSINPEADRNRRKIFEYRIIDRETDLYQKTNAQGVKIENNLSFNDLYTFEFLDNQTRNNFESFFQNYESEIEVLTKNLIEKSKNNQPITEDEAFRLITSKFMNFIRNPFSIQKVINTFKEIKNYSPSDEKLTREFNKISNDNILLTPNYLNQLNVSKNEYIEWLKIIFLTFSVTLHQKPLVESLIKKMMNSQTLLRIDFFEKEICLLSDRGFIDQSQLFEGSLSMSFNITKNAFLTIIVLNEYTTPSNEKSQSMNALLQYIEKDDMDMLAKYNSNVRYQCHKNFYSAQENFL